MNKLLLIPMLLSMAACATSDRAPSSKLNCEKLHQDSEAKLVELQKVFTSFQDISYDLAVKLTPALKEQADQLDVRIKKQKQRCWAKENRDIDSEMASLKEELTKTYGDMDQPKAPVRIPTSDPTPSATAPEAPAPTVPLEK